MPLADTLIEQQKRKAEAARKSTTLPDTLAGQASRLFQSNAPKITLPSLPRPSFTQPSKPATAPAKVSAKPAARSNEPSSAVWPTLSTRVTTNPEPGHMAIDIAGAAGDPIFSPVFGTVEDIQRQSTGYGWFVEVKAADTGMHWILAHLSAFIPGLQVGQQVQAGQELGLMGSTGHSSGPHLHEEVRLPDYGASRFLPDTLSGIGAIDPRQFYPFGPVAKTDHALGYDVSSYDWAPGIASQAAAAFMPASAPSLPGVGQDVPWTSGGQTTTATAPKTKGAAKAGTQGAAPEAQAASAAPASQGIPVLSTPFGDIKIPWPQTGDNPVKSLGDLIKRNVVVAIGGVVVLIAIGALIWRNPTVKAATKTAVKGAVKAAAIA